MEILDQESLEIGDEVKLHGETATVTQVTHRIAVAISDIHKYELVPHNNTWRVSKRIELPGRRKEPKVGRMTTKEMRAYYNKNTRRNEVRKFTTIPPGWFSDKQKAKANFAKQRQDGALRRNEDFEERQRQKRLEAQRNLRKGRG